MIGISTASMVGTAGAKGYRPPLDVTTIEVEDCTDYFGSDLVTIRATRVVGQLAYDDRPHRLGVEELVMGALLRTIDSSAGGPAIRALIAGPPAVRPFASWRQLGGHRVLDDGSILEPDWIYAVGYEIPRSVLQGATRTVT